MKEGKRKKKGIMPKIKFSLDDTIVQKLEYIKDHPTEDTAASDQLRRLDINEFCKAIITVYAYKRIENLFSGK